MTSPLSAVLFGATGLTGSQILSSLLAPDSPWDPVHTISRRAPKAPSPSSPALNAVVEADTGSWAAKLKALPSTPAVAFSALGTTRAAAGGIQAQWKIDHDLNVELARAAKDAGVGTFVFVSSAGTRGFLASRAPYSQMKNGVEDAVRDLGFGTSIILKPGLLLGVREEQRLAEKGIQAAVYGLGHLHGGIRDALGQEVDAIARAAIRAARMAIDGKAPSRHWVLEAADIIKLGSETG